MNKHSSLAASGSLLERAAQIYNFETELLTRPVAGPPAMQPPSSVSPQAESEVTPADAAPVRAAPDQARGGRSAIVDRQLIRKAGFLLPDAPISALAEEFRIIKRQLLLGVSATSTVAEAKRQTILVCSAQPNEGKTFCAINLALSMAGEKDIDVLLVDGDFAKPEIPSLLGLKTGPGLTDAIADLASDPNDFVIRTDIGGLSVLPAGRQLNNTTELLASGRTAKVLAALAEGRKQRVIIFDSPPALVASPAAVLASHAGQVMMVVRADSTTETDLREALALLSACDSISLMLNRASLAVSGRKFGSYYGLGQ